MSDAGKIHRLESCTHYQCMADNAAVLTSIPSMLEQDTVYIREPLMGDIQLLDPNKRTVDNRCRQTGDARSIGPQLLVFMRNKILSAFRNCQ